MKTYGPTVANPDDSQYWFVIPIIFFLIEGHVDPSWTFGHLELLQLDLLFIALVTHRKCTSPATV